MSNFKQSILDSVIKSIKNGELVRANISLDKKQQQFARFILESGVSVSVTNEEEIFINFHFFKGEQESIDFSTAFLLAGKDRVRRAEQRLQNEKAKYQELIDTTSKNH